MKFALFVVVVLTVAVNVQGEGKCGNGDRSFCPEGTTGVTITKKTLKTDNTKLEVTIKCEDSNIRVVAQCVDIQTSPFPNVQINSYQFSGNFKHSVQKHNHNVITNTNTNDNDDIETFD